MKMEPYMKNRPQKKVYSKNKIEGLRGVAIEKIKSKLLPEDKIIKIILIGSSIKESFGGDASPGFRGSLYSDFDFIVYVEDNYKIPSWLDGEPDGKPFPDDELNLAYRNRKFVEDKYDVEVFFVRKKSLKDSRIRKLGESAGIPMSERSENKCLVVYSIK